MDKKKEIIKGVKTLVLKKGYNNVSVEDITTYIGIAKGSFYTYFKSKKFTNKLYSRRKKFEIKNAK